MSTAPIDIDAYTAASVVFKRKTGRLLTLDEYQAMTQASPTPFLTVVLAAEYAQANAEADHDAALEREEMWMTPREQASWHNPKQTQE